jgi:hypothetical protein
LHVHTAGGGPRTSIGAERRKIREVIRLLVVLSPTPWSIEGLVEAVAAYLGVEISIASTPLERKPGKCSGMWIRQSDGRVNNLLFAEDADPVERVQIILHELCHMLLGHIPVDAVPMETLRQRYPNLPEEVRVGFCRARVTYHGDPEEQAAESTATKVRLGATLRRRPMSSETELGRLMNSLR